MIAPDLQSLFIGAIIGAILSLALLHVRRLAYALLSLTAAYIAYTAIASGLTDVVDSIRSLLQPAFADGQLLLGMLFGILTVVAPESQNRKRSERDL